MNAAHEELEVGHELDRALRAAVTGLSQVMERVARRRQDQTRDTAGTLREDWLARRDAARRQYLPMLGEGRLEKLAPAAAAQRWAVAAAWSSMDPTARLAEQDMAGRIQQAHGKHPSELMAAAAAAAPATAAVIEETPAAKLLSMNEAYGLATRYAPSWYVVPEGVVPLEQDRPPANAVEERFHSDWQHFSENGALPDVTRWEQWAQHVGRGEEFDEANWIVNGGEQLVDAEGREAALAALWIEGREQRAADEVVDHEAALFEAGMDPLVKSGMLVVDAGDVADLDDALSARGWNAYLTPSRFDAAKPNDLAAAWRDAAAAGYAGDVGAERAAERIAWMMRERRGINPESYLIAALADQAAANTEGRRAAEDRARKIAEATRPEVDRAPATYATTQPTLTRASTNTAGTTAASNTAGSTAGSTARGADTPDGEKVTRERVLQINDMAAAYYAADLRPGTAGHRYLADRLGSEFEAGPWALGYARPGWQNLTKHLREQGVTDAEMVAAGLAENGKFGVRDVFRDRVMMGVRDENGELVGFLGRDLSGDERAPKVKNTGLTEAFRKGDHVFGLYEAAPGARIVRVEGPFDAMAVTLASNGEAAGVSTMGTAMTDRQTQLIVERAADHDGRVWLANDNDQAGRQATEKDYFQLSAKGLDVRQVDVPGSDPAAAWRDSPAMMQTTLAMLPEARSAAETVVDNYLSSPDATREGFQQVMTKIEPHLGDEMERNLLAMRVVELDMARAEREAAERDEATARSVYDSRIQGDGNGPADSEETDARPHQNDQVDLVDDARWRERDVNEHDVAAAREQLHAAEDAVNRAEAVEAAAYDRRDEAAQDLSEQADRARTDSSHGFAKSTKDQVAGAPVRRTGAQARPQRGDGRSQGRTRARG